MNDTPSELRLKDPLSDLARRERKYLLLTSALAFVMLTTGLIPSKISALGIDFEHTDQRSILNILWAIILYFLCAFIMYSISDFLAWRIAITNSIREAYRKRNKQNAEDKEIENYLNQEFRMRFKMSLYWNILANPISIIKAFFEFLLPPIIAITALVLLSTTNISDIKNGSVETNGSNKAVEEMPSGSAPQHSSP